MREYGVIPQQQSIFFESGSEMKNHEKFWVWGYILDQVPGKAMFVNEPTRCSLETGVHYMGCEGAFWMNALHDLDALCDEQLQRLQGIPNVICGLTHIETNGPGLGGWCLLQSGFFCQQNHRRQVEYVRNYWNWFCDTRTVL